MRNNLGLLLVEEPDGRVAVELFKRPEPALRAFDELAGTPGDAPSRATFLVVDWDQGEVSEMRVRQLPARRGKDPWGWKLGEGPVDEPEGKDGRAEET